MTRESQPLRGRSGRTLPAPYTLHTGGADLKVIPRPGLHSEADLIVYLPAESVVAMGDLLLSESMPAVSDVDGYLAFLDDVLDVFPDKTTFVSGHGRDLNAAGVRAYRDALVEMVGVIRTNLAAGRTADRMVADGVLKPYEARFSLLEFLVPDTLLASGQVFHLLQRVDLELVEELVEACAVPALEVRRREAGDPPRHRRSRAPERCRSAQAPRARAP